ncbi:MAG: hypothetical protein OEZ06_22085 [Myxococcales bacterium]|nr:hypothetical protein [Myxococcales bacterium]
MSPSAQTSEATPRWPAGAPYALCLTHDVDRIHKQAYHYLYYAVRGGSRALRVQARSLLHRLMGDEPYWNFDRIMALEDRLGVRSTVLFLDESTKSFDPRFMGRYDLGDRRLAQTIPALKRGGWEIGLHGSFYSFDDRALLAREKARLEDIVGDRVRSTRQHHLNLVRPRTFQHQRAIGLEVDSTLGAADRAWSEAPCLEPFEVDDSGMLELPITLMDIIGLSRPGVRRHAEMQLEAIASAGGLIVLDWHQRTFSPHEYPAEVAFYEAQITAAKRRGAWIATMAEICDHWHARGAAMQVQAP